MIAAAVTQFVAWFGAVINTAGLQDKTWLSFGFISMIIYLIAGPDDPPRVSTEPALRQTASRGLRSRSA